MPQKQKSASIHQHLDIKEIKDDVVVLKSGGLRAILITTSINFALKSTEEQNAVIYRYQNFINSLDFPIQIVAASRKFDIDPYISSLEQKQVQQEGIKDAIIAAYLNGKRITLEQAKEIEKEK